jgi:hypothetical protein
MLTTHLIKVGGALYLCVPRKTARTLGWEEGESCELKLLLDGGLKVKGLKYGRKNTKKSDGGAASAQTAATVETDAARDSARVDRSAEVGDAGNDERNKT